MLHERLPKHAIAKAVRSVNNQGVVYKGFLGAFLGGLFYLISSLSLSYRIVDLIRLLLLRENCCFVEIHFGGKVGRSTGS